ncbi:14708_t:CDS:2, partial [Acaulospora colombiana]
TAKARERHNNASNQLRNAERKLSEEEQALSKLSDPAWFGVDGIPMRSVYLDKQPRRVTRAVATTVLGTSISAMFASQPNILAVVSLPGIRTPLLGHQNIILDKSINMELDAGTVPSEVDLVCGTENALLTVSEPEKCEYHVTGTTPALCINGGNASAETSSSTKADPTLKEEL